GLQPDVLIGHTTPSVIVLRKETDTIPIVFVQISDPIGTGFITNLARPGGNVTGFTNFEASMGGKWVEVLKDLDPRIRQVAVLFNPETAPAGGKFYLPSLKLAANALGVELTEAPVHD